MLNKISAKNKAYLAGFIDGDGSIYVRLKPSREYRYGYQVAPYIILFQAKKEETAFKSICSLIGSGYMRERKDGILEYTINRRDDIKVLIKQIYPYLILKKKQAKLMVDILDAKSKVKDENDFKALMALIDEFRTLNYSKKRKIHNLTP